MINILNNSIVLLLIKLVVIIQPTTIYHNDYEPRVFDHMPLNCYDCLSYRDIILTQLNDVPARSFAGFNLGSLDTFMILNGQVSLKLHPYAFQSLIVHKPNRTLTITLTAPNSWLNITEDTFNGLELHAHSTLRIIIKFFYGCTFHKNSLSGIKMAENSNLILDISSVTEIIFENNVIKENDFNSSVKFLISRTDTIIFETNAFAQLNINPTQTVSFYFELISHIHFKPHSFTSLKLEKSSAFNFYAIFLNRLTFDSYAFDNSLLDSNSTFNFTVHKLGTCLCFESHSFHNLQTKRVSENILILFDFHTLRGLSFLSETFSNLSLNNQNNQLKIQTKNPVNDPNPIINFETDTFSTIHSGKISLHFSESVVVRFDRNSLKANYLTHEIFFKDISLVDLSALNYNTMKTKFHLFFHDIEYVKWHRYSMEDMTLNHQQSLVEYHFNHLTNASCVIYSASTSIPWIFPISNLTMCNCPLFYAYKYGQVKKSSIPCLNLMSQHDIIQEMNECDFDQLENDCHSTIQSLTTINTTNENPSKVFHSFELDNLLIQKLYDKNYLTCSFNYSLLSSSTINIRSRLLNHFSLVVGVALAVFIIVLILVMVLLNSLQYKMREYDESWTWRRNMSWTTLRRTLSQTSLRRTRRDLCTSNHRVVTSKSDNQLDRLRYEQATTDDINDDIDYDLKQSESVQENKQFYL